MRMHSFGVKRKLVSAISPVMEFFWSRGVQPPVVVASIGRSGSTLLTRSLREGMSRARFGFSPGFFYNKVKGDGFDLSNTRFRDGVVYKTHALPSELPGETTVKVVFVYGSASDAVISVALQRDKLGDSWVQNHLRHLRADGQFYEVLDRDVLRIREQVQGWAGKLGVDRVLVKYDNLWSSVDTISNFLGFPIFLPERRVRRSGEQISLCQPDKIREAYSALDSMIDGYPGCVVLRKGEML